MNKICTTIEQSRKLLELGIDVKTADMYWWSSGKRYYIEAIDDGDFNEEEGYIYAWSLTSLLELMPFHIIENNERYRFSMTKGLDKNGETYAIKYVIFNTTFYLHLTDFYNNPIDAAIEMICWLKENGKI